MKVDFDAYKKAVSYAMVAEEVVPNVSEANKMLNFIEKFLSENLVCGNCKAVLPDDQFYSSRSHANRRGRNSTCKECFSQVYTQK